MRRCRYCNATSEEKIISSLFLDFNTANNDRDNLVPACEACISAYKLKRAINAIIVLRALGFKTDKKAEWRYDDKKIRNELVNVAEQEAIIGQLKSEIHDLEGYINMLTKHDYESFDSTATGKYSNKRVYVVDKDEQI